MMKGDEVIEREEIMIEGTEKTTAAEAEVEDEGEVAEAEVVTDITLKEGIEKREIAVTMIEEISPQVKQEPVTTMKLPEPRIIIGRRMDGDVMMRVKNKRPL